MGVTFCSCSYVSKKQSEKERENKWEMRGKSFFISECFNISVKLAVIKQNCRGWEIWASACVSLCVCVHCTHCYKMCCTELHQRGETVIYLFYLWEIDHSALKHSFFSPLKFPLSFVLSLSLLYACPPFTHKYHHGDRRWREGLSFPLWKCRKKHSWCLSIFSSSLPHRSLFHSIFYYLHYSVCTTFSCWVAIFDIIIKSLSAHPSCAESVSSSHSQIVEIKIDSVHQLMKSTLSQQWLTLFTLGDDIMSSTTCAHTNTQT